MTQDGAPPLRLLAFTAHPDDEISVCAASFAHLKRVYGPRVETAIACATRGENYARKGFDPVDRERELRLAAERLGVDRVRFLGFRNGAMIQMLGPINGRVIYNERWIPINTNWFDGLRPGHAWEDHVEAVRILGELPFGLPPDVEGYDPRGSILAPLVEATVAAIREEKPDVVVTLEPFGGYGHNEHIMVHHAATAATCLSGREDVWPEHAAMQGLAPHAPRRLYWGGLQPENARRSPERRAQIAEARAEMGVPEFAPSLVVSYPEVEAQVYDALCAHQSQFPDLRPWAEVPADLRRYMGADAMLRVYPPRGEGEAPESSIVDGLID
jgi:LmbE family N-acetylglucosaminyl deacetylase